MGVVSGFAAGAPNAFPGNHYAGKKLYANIEVGVPFKLAFTVISKPFVPPKSAIKSKLINCTGISIPNVSTVLGEITSPSKLNPVIVYVFAALLTQLKVLGSG